MTASDVASNVPLQVASALVGGPVVALEQIGGGRNSRVYRVRTAGEQYALKQYPSRDDDPRDRLGNEVAALRLMEQFQLKSVPRVAGVDQKRNFVLLSWIEGQPVIEAGADDIDQACDFLSAVHALRRTSVIPVERHAAEACLSGAEIERQIEARLASLHKLPAEEAELFGFLLHQFAPTRLRLMAQARAKMAAIGLDFEQTLPQQRRTLAPADFGFHNSLRQPDGSLAFFDFEYFGWDDPVKLTADVLLHPGTALKPELRSRFRAAAEAIYGSDPSFHQRLDALFPLIGLRWVLILLNEFRPEYWRRRQLAGFSGDRRDVSARQLDRARELLARLDTSNDLQQYS
jgi:Phosphotransferase enzyme family